MGESTGAGVIFGATGGVMEAALRTAAEVAHRRAAWRMSTLLRCAAPRASRRPPYKIGGHGREGGCVPPAPATPAKLLDAVKRGEKQITTSSRSWAAPAAASMAAASPSQPAPVRNWTDVPRHARQGALWRGRGQDRFARAMRTPKSRSFTRSSWASPTAIRRTCCCIRLMSSAISISEFDLLSRRRGLSRRRACMCANKNVQRKFLKENTFRPFVHKSFTIRRNPLKNQHFPQCGHRICPLRFLGKNALIG